MPEVGSPSMQTRDASQQAREPTDRIATQEVCNPAKFIHEYISVDEGNRGGTAVVSLRKSQSVCIVSEYILSIVQPPSPWYGVSIVQSAYERSTAVARYGTPSPSLELRVVIHRKMSSRKSENIESEVGKYRDMSENIAATAVC